MSVQTGLQIERIIATPKQWIWLGFTKSSFFNSWFGCNGVSVVSSVIEPNQGGTFEYLLKSNDGKEFRFAGRFEEVLEERLISYTGFSVDENREFMPNSNILDWPRQTLVTVKLETVDEKTRLTLNETPINPTEQEMSSFESNLHIAEKCWNEALQKLNDYSVDFWK